MTVNRFVHQSGRRASDAAWSGDGVGRLRLSAAAFRRRHCRLCRGLFARRLRHSRRSHAQKGRHGALRPAQGQRLHFQGKNKKKKNRKNTQTHIDGISFRVKEKPSKSTVLAQSRFW